MEEDLAAEMVPSNGSPSESDAGGREDSHTVSGGRGSSLSGRKRTTLRLLRVQKAKERLAKDHVKLNSFALINRMRRAPVEKSLLRIPLCRLVRPTLDCDVDKLANMFQDGYLEHVGAFYVSNVDEDGARKEVTAELVSS